ncbi:MAG: hypothetical protein WDN31_19085 [Hyphomicrobium sp.]
MSVASGFVDFATGRYSIITAPGPGVPTPGEGVQLFADEAAQCAGDRRRAEEPVSGAKGSRHNRRVHAVRSGLHRWRLLSTGWLTGGLGGAEAIVVGQLSGPGAVKVYSSGSRLQGGPRTTCKVPPRHRRADLHEHYAVHAVRGRLRGARCDDEHDCRRRPARQRHRARGQERKGSEVSTRQAHGGRTSVDAKQIGEVSSTSGAFANC